MQAPQRMQRSIFAISPPNIDVRRLSTKTMCISSGPSLSPERLGPLKKVTYWVNSLPNADLDKSLRKTAVGSRLGTSFSMPTVTMWQGGSAVVSSAFPSFVTVKTEPLSAARKFAPEIAPELWINAVKNPLDKAKAEKRVRGITLTDAIDQVLSEKASVLKKTTIEDYRKVLLRHFSDWGSKPIGQITTQDITKRYAHIREGIKKRSRVAIDTANPSAEPYAQKAIRYLSAKLSHQ